MKNEDYEPTITKLKEKLADVHEKIEVYKVLVHCRTYPDTYVGLPNKCLTEIWKGVGCTNLDVTNNYSNDGWWKKQSKSVVKSDMNAWATMNDDVHRNLCYGTDKSKWPTVASMASSPVASRPTAASSPVASSPLAGISPLASSPLASSPLASSPLATSTTATSSPVAPEIRCSNDLTSTSVSVDCLNDLWSSAGTNIPIPIPAMPSGTVSIPGTAYTFDISGGKVDMSRIPGMNLGSLRQALALIAPQTSRNVYGGAAESPIDKMRDAIVADLTEINAIINHILPLTGAYKSQTDASVTTFLNQFEQMNAECQVLNDALKIPSELDGKYQASHIETASNFSHYILFIILAIFFLGSLIYILKNPDVGNLDLFILALAIVILSYYLYRYIVQKMRQK
jgi:hypothetical protein